MASSTLRPHRSPSPSPTPAPPVNPANPAKLTRQSLGPPTASGVASAARGFGVLGAPISSPGMSQPRHVSSSVTLGLGGSAAGRETLSPRPSLGTNRAVSGGGTGRPSSEFLPSGRELRTPEAEQIDQWFKHLASWEATLEEMAAASTDQNFTEELGAIEQWFRVLSEAERTAALYSLLQHSTPVQIRFFLSVLHHMAQADPLTALISPTPSVPPSMHAQMESKLVGMGLKSPSAGGGTGFSGSPTGNNFLAPESALDPGASKSKLRQNRISAPGTLSSTDARWSSQLDQVVERGPSPGLDDMSIRSRSPQPDPRPKSTDFSGLAHDPSGFRRSPTPRLSSGPGSIGLGIQSDAPSPVASPLITTGNWASMVNTPLIPMFPDAKSESVGGALNLANLQLAANAVASNRVQLDDARKFRRPGAGGNGPSSRNVSGASNYEDDLGRSSPYLMGGTYGWNPNTRSPVPGADYGGLNLSDPNVALAGLGMNLANLGINPLAPNAVQMLAMAQAQAAQQLGNYYQQAPTLSAPRPTQPRGHPGRRSPMLGKSNSPSPMRDLPPAAGGGAGGGAGVAGPDDVDIKVIDDVSLWLRVLRLHKYTTNFEQFNWRDMIAMTDTDLQDQGVAAQGARSKFLKVFYNVRTKYNIPHPEGQEEYAPGASKDDK